MIYMEIVMHFDMSNYAGLLNFDSQTGQAPEKTTKMGLKMQYLDKSYKIPKIVLEFWLE